MPQSFKSKPVVVTDKTAWQPTSKVKWLEGCCDTLLTRQYALTCTFSPVSLLCFVLPSCNSPCCSVMCSFLCDPLLGFYAFCCFPPTAVFFGRLLVSLLLHFECLPFSLSARWALMYALWIISDRLLERISVVTPIRTNNFWLLPKNN
jgi:hypothetical protein